MPKTHTAISLHTIPSPLLFLSSLPLSLSSFPLFLSFWLLSLLFASSFLLSSFSFRLLLFSSLPWLFFSLLLPYSFLLLPSFSPPRLHYRYHLSWNQNWNWNCLPLKFPLLNLMKVRKFLLRIHFQTPLRCFLLHCRQLASFSFNVITLQTLKVEKYLIKLHFYTLISHKNLYHLFLRLSIFKWNI